MRSRDDSGNDSRRRLAAWRGGPDSTAFVLSVLLIGCGVGIACAEQAAQLRRHTYPPDFQYITDAEISSTMWQVAALTTRLDEIFDDSELVAVHRIEILTILDQLDAATDALRKEGVATNHAVIDDHLDTFRSDIEKARMDVAREPPSYLRASALPGACKYCHGG